MHALASLTRSSALIRPWRGGGGLGGGVVGRCFSAAPRKRDVALIRELREASGAPMVDCKKALTAEGVDGDIAKAFEWLRKRGIAKASAMADRSANEGVIGLRVDGRLGVLIEVNSETDFVARNSKFQEFVGKAMGAALELAGTGDAVTTDALGGGQDLAFNVRALDLQQLLRTEPPGSEEALGDSLADLVGSIRENITVSRAQVMSMDEGSGLIEGYVHAAVGPGMGKNAALVALKFDSAAEAGEGVVDALRASAKSLSMHVVAARPAFLDETVAPAQVLAKETKVYLQQAEESGKERKFWDKMVEGRLMKYMQANALVRQPHVIAEGNPIVADVLTALGEEVGAAVTVEAFARLSVGERVISHTD